MILNNYVEFIDNIYQKLLELGININELSIDHIAYQASSVEDYDQRILELSDLVTKFSGNMVAERRVGILKFHNPIEYKSSKIEVMEIVEPKAGQEASSNWEHIEFLVNGTLEEFMNKYSSLEWDTTVLNRDEFPMLILKLGDGLRAKFPRRGVIEEVERQRDSK